MPEPCPPPEGWTPIEAVEALFPELASECWAADDPLASFHAMSGPLIRHVARQRPDLTFIGRDARAGIDAAPVTVPRDYLAGDLLPAGALVLLSVRDATLRLRLGRGRETELQMVRVVAARNAPRVEEVPAPALRPAFAPDLARGWYRLRVAGWPKDAAPPSEADDLAAMRAAHDGTIPRDFIREVRRKLAPPEWRKSGPRKRR